MSATQASVAHPDQEELQEDDVVIPQRGGDDEDDEDIAQQYEVVHEEDVDDEDGVAPKRMALAPSWASTLPATAPTVIRVGVGESNGAFVTEVDADFTPVVSNGAIIGHGPPRRQGGARRKLKGRGYDGPNLLQMGDKIDPNFRQGFTYHVDAPTSIMVRDGEDNLTYMNKDQFYALTLQFVPGNKTLLQTDTVISIITLQFREKKDRREALRNWEFWHVRQHSAKTRLLDVDAKLASGIVGDIHEMAHNAVWLRWSPTTCYATVPITIRCLSTDFSSQKGVKGIPLHVQIDTYECENCELKGLLDRSFCQIKTFCDKGAERKAREEERRITGQHGPGVAAVAQQQSIFQRSYDLVTRPVFYTPSTELVENNAVLPNGERIDVDGDLVHDIMENGRPAAAPLATPTTSVTPPRPRTKPSPPEDDMVNLKSPIKTATGMVSKVKRPRPPRSERVMLYVRQENEDIYSALHVVPPTIRGLVNAISGKYQIEVADIRFLFRKTPKGILVKMDDEMINYYTTGDVFLMKVLATEDPESNAVFYDVVFAESDVHGPEGEAQGRHEHEAALASNGSGVDPILHSAGARPASAASNEEDSRAGLADLVAASEMEAAAAAQAVDTKPPRNRALEQQNSNSNESRDRKKQKSVPKAS